MVVIEALSISFNDQMRTSKPLEANIIVKAHENVRRVLAYLVFISSYLFCYVSFKI